MREREMDSGKDRSNPAAGIGKDSNVSCGELIPVESDYLANVDGPPKIERTGNG